MRDSQLDDDPRDRRRGRRPAGDSRGDGPGRTPPRRLGRHGLLTLGALLALLLGVVAGMLLRGIEAAWAVRTIDALELVTGTWVDLLRLLVLPLVVTQLFLAVRRLRGAPDLGRIGVVTVGVFLLLLCVGNAVALAGGFVAFSAYMPELSVAGTPTPVDPSAAGAPLAPGVAARVLNTLTSAPVLLSAIFGAILAGFLAGMLPAAIQRRLDALGERAADGVRAAFGVLLLATPVAAFTLALTFSARQGTAMAGALAWYLVVLCALLVVLTALLYPLASLATGIPLRQWAAALLPAQVLAVATRSSLATVPALLEAGRELGLPAAVRDFVVPFAASTFKPSTTVSGVTTLMFLSTAFDVPLSVYQVLGFLVADAIISVADVGLPRVMPQMKTLPLYLALGIPLEGYVLARSVAVLSDVLKTVTNTTGYLAAATLVTGLRARRLASEPVVGVTGE